MNITQLKPEQHAKLLEHVKTMTHYVNRLLNRLAQRDFKKHSEFVQKTLQVQRALSELEHYIHCNPRSDRPNSELPSSRLDAIEIFPKPSKGGACYHQSGGLDFRRFPAIRYIKRSREAADG